MHLELALLGWHLEQRLSALSSCSTCLLIHLDHAKFSFGNGVAADAPAFPENGENHVMCYQLVNTLSSVLKQVVYFMFTGECNLRSIYCPYHSLLFLLASRTLSRHRESISAPNREGRV